MFLSESGRHAGSDLWLSPHVEILRGKRYLVKAASGKGKSSLCAYIYGTRTDYEGSLAVNGMEMRSASPRAILDLRRNVLAYLPQEMKLFPSLTAMENILLKNNLTGHKSQEEIARMLEAVGLADHAHRKAACLSIGQQQRVALVRALCQPFDFLLLDEPSSHLDDTANDAISALVDRETSANGAGVIVTSVGNDLHLADCIPLSL